MENTRLDELGTKAARLDEDFLYYLVYAKLSVPADIASSTTRKHETLLASSASPSEDCTQLTKILPTTSCICSMFFENLALLHVRMRIV
jgi:hypothetical protein